MSRDDEGNPFAVEARERLERVFTDLSRQPFARIVPAAPPEGIVRPRRERLQGALSRAGASSAAEGRAFGRAGRRHGTESVPARVRIPAPAGPAVLIRRDADGGSASGAAHLKSLMQRLDKIEKVLAEIKNPLRAGPATRELFREWIRNGHWEDVSFGDYVRLRRAGLI